MQLCSSACVAVSVCSLVRFLFVLKLVAFVVFGVFISLSFGGCTLGAFVRQTFDDSSVKNSQFRGFGFWQIRFALRLVIQRFATVPHECKNKRQLLCSTSNY